MTLENEASTQRQNVKKKQWQDKMSQKNEGIHFINVIGSILTTSVRGQKCESEIAGGILTDCTAVVFLMSC
jgi:hypothetical protein